MVLSMMRSRARLRIQRGRTAFLGMGHPSPQAPSILAAEADPFADAPRCARLLRVGGGRRPYIHAGNPDMGVHRRVPRPVSWHPRISRRGRRRSGGAAATGGKSLPSLMTTFFSITRFSADDPLFPLDLLGYGRALFDRDAIGGGPAALAASTEAATSSAANLIMSKSPARVTRQLYKLFSHLSDHPQAADNE